MIKASHLFKTYDGRSVVDDISFEVDQGSLMVLLGTSGSGKTTTLKMINRLIEPNNGKILINGLNISHLNKEKLRRNIGYVSQNDGLFPHYTVEQNIGILPRLLSWKPSKIRQYTVKTMEQVLLSFDEFHLKYPHELSGGQKQRVALARALISDPDILLMDEPFGALDPITRADIGKEMGNIIKSSGKTIVLVTHDIKEAVELGDQIALMDHGKIVQIGTAQDLIFSPESQFARDFFASQKLPLELSITHLSDIWNALPEATFESHITINKNISIWETVNLISKENLTAVNIENEAGERKSADMAQIMKAYQHLRHQND